MIHWKQRLQSLWYSCYPVSAVLTLSCPPSSLILSLPDEDTLNFAFYLWLSIFYVLSLLFYTWSSSRHCLRFETLTKNSTNPWSRRMIHSFLWLVKLFHTRSTSAQKFLCSSGMSHSFPGRPTLKIWLMSSMWTTQTSRRFYATTTIGQNLPAISLPLFWAVSLLSAGSNSY